VRTDKKIKKKYKKSEPRHRSTKEEIEERRREMATRCQKSLYRGYIYMHVYICICIYVYMHVYVYVYVKPFRVAQWQHVVKSHYI